ncbi:MAG: hypothetical protein A2Z70_01165 [Chloroflexi bacterium RBG_13_48_17]|nr:MAG: hypothetical protein A2Z70_01165 [Chloroflexi bacterium RBG_13_48_17]
MKRLLATLKRIPVLSYALVGAAVIIIIIAAIIGIDSDRGVLVGWIGIILLLTELTRRWRKEWHFLLLVAGAFIGAIILSGLYEAAIYPLVEKIGGASAVQSRGLEIFHDILTDILLLVTPMAIIYGILGAITLFALRLIIICRKRLSEKT